jgi:hypothetical protein
MGIDQSCAWPTIFAGLLAVFASAAVLPTVVTAPLTYCAHPDTHATAHVHIITYVQTKAQAETYCKQHKK